MKKIKEDFYISMLRYGKIHIDRGFTLMELVEHLKKKGFPISSEHDILLTKYFPSSFCSLNNNNNAYPDYSSFFFLSPESYFRLLQYDSMLSTRKQAKIATVIAIVAIIIPFVYGLFRMNTKLI